MYEIFITEVPDTVVHDNHINPDCACWILQSMQDRGC